VPHPLGARPEEQAATNIFLPQAALEIAEQGALERPPKLLSTI
jgi:hypothetical protein